ncbi:MAG: hypothetical protein V3R77_08755, partial [Candidatus Binatia bacterium]
MDLRDFKRECILAEHENLSRVVETELLATTLVRALALSSWLVAMTVAVAYELSIVAILFTVVPAAIGLWLVDVYFSYVGVIYKVRRKQLREWIDQLPAADEATLKGWKSPVNPFDVLAGGQKKQALRDAFVSPAVWLPYAFIDLGTLLLIGR